MRKVLLSFLISVLFAPAFARAQCLFCQNADWVPPPYNGFCQISTQGLGCFECVEEGQYCTRPCGLYVCYAPSSCEGVVETSYTSTGSDYCAAQPLTAVRAKGRRHRRMSQPSAGLISTRG